MFITVPIIFMVLAGGYLSWRCDEPSEKTAALGQILGGVLIISGLVTLGYQLGLRVHL
jgi:hypothetical protein